MTNITIDNQLYTLIEGKRFIRNGVYAFDVCVLKLNKTNEYYLQISKEDDYNHKNQVITIPMSMLSKILPHIIDASHTYGITNNTKDSKDPIAIHKHRPLGLLDKHPENRWKEIDKMFSAFLATATIHSKLNP